MGNICASKTTSEFIALQKLTEVSPNRLAIDVGVWQEKNGLDKYPTINDIPLETLVRDIEGVSLDKGGYFLTKNGEINARNKIAKLNKELGYKAIDFKKANKFGGGGRIITYLTFDYQNAPKPVVEEPIDLLEEDTVDPRFERIWVRDMKRLGIDRFGDSDTSMYDPLTQLEGNDKPVNPKVETEMKRLISELGISLINYEEYAEYYKQKYGKELTANAVADMFNKVIAIKDGSASEDTLPEEVGHFIIYALKSDPRVIKAMENVNLTKMWELHKDQYMEAYDNNESKVREEILGKLLAQSLINNIQDESPSWKRLMKQIWSKFLDFFTFGTKAKTARIRNTIDSIARETLKDSSVVKEALSTKVSDRNNVMFQLDPKDFENSKILSPMKKELEKALGAIHNKIRLYNHKEFKGYLANEEELRKTLALALKDIPEGHKDKYSKDRTTLGLINFIAYVEKEADVIIDKARYIQKSFEDGIYDNDVNEFAKMLNEIRDYIAVYEPIIRTISAQTEKDRRRIKKEEGNIIGDTSKHDLLIDSFNNIKNGIDLMKEDYDNYSKPILLELFRPFLMRSSKFSGDETKVQQELDRLEKLMSETTRDIGWDKKLMDSMAESQDALLGFLDRVTKEQLESAAFEVEDVSKDLIDLDTNYKESGGENTTFMYERLNDEYTGNFVYEFNMKKFEDAKAKFKRQLNKQYKLPLGDDLKSERERIYILSHMEAAEAYAYRNALKAWENENTDINPKYQELIKEKKRRITNSIITFKKDRQHIISLQKKHPKTWLKILKKDDRILYDKVIKVNEIHNNWVNDRRIFDEVGNVAYREELAVPKKSIYGNPQYTEIMNDSAKKTYYEGIMNIRKKLVSNMGEEYANSVLAPQIKKDFIERLSGDAVNVVKETVKESFQRQVDDTEFGKQLQNEDGTPLEKIPIFYFAKLENVNRDMSLDATASMILFADMAIRHKKLNKVVDTMQIAGNILKERKIVDATGFKESFYNKLAPALVRGVGGNAAARFDDYMKAIYFNETKVDQGEILGFNTAKVADALIQYTALNSLALNIYAGFNNVLLGNIMVREEAFAKEFVNHEDLLFATKTYWSEIGGVMGDVGKVRSSNKMRLLFEHLDVFQDHESRAREVNTERSRWGKMFDRSTLFFINKGGEHQIQGRMALGMMHNMKLKDANGKEINLYDAFTVENYRVKLIDGVTKLDGTPVTEHDLIAFKLKLKGINQRLHGIYNVTDRSAMQRYWQGRAVILFRKWIKPGLNRRFGSQYFNYSMDTDVEGMYRTSFRFLTTLYQEVKAGQFEIAYMGDKFDQLEDWEKANIRRNATEIGYFLALTATGLILSSLTGDDDEDWVLNMMAYQVNRLGTELGFYTNPSDMLKLIQSPSATINQLERIGDLIKVIDPIGFVAEDDPFFRTYKSGRNKDNTYLNVWAKRTVPMWRSVDDWFHPDEKLKFFTN